MTYKTDKLKQYQTLKVKREDRFKSLGDEISKAENINTKGANAPYFYR